MPLTRINDMTESGTSVHSGLGQMGCMDEFKIESNELACTLWWNRSGSSKTCRVTLRSWLASISLQVLAYARQCHMSLSGLGYKSFYDYLVTNISVGMSYLEQTN